MHAAKYICLSSLFVLIFSGCPETSENTDDQNEQHESFVQDNITPEEANIQRGVLALANHATPDMFEHAIKLDDVVAQNIIEARELSPFKTIEQLDDVDYVGKNAYSLLRDYAIKFGFVPFWKEGINGNVPIKGHEKTGQIAARETFRFQMDVAKDDHVVVWLKIKDNTSWAPSLAFFDQSNQQMVLGNPDGRVDASIPQKADLEMGWSFTATQTIEIELNNDSNDPGAFDFEVVCISGPCADPIVDPPKPLKVKLRETYYTNHKDLGYRQARFHMFVDMDKVDGEVECVYTGKRFPVEDDIPNHMVVNTEHVWPQSRGAEGVAKADLNHLFPTDSNANNARSSYKFGKVVEAQWTEGGSKLGFDEEGQMRFEPRDVVKGNIARASMYFSVMYDYTIDDDEEAVFRLWHKADPVDEKERARDGLILKYQLSHNPFVDKPELVDQIDDF